ncbi:glycosyltransferase [Nocardia niigatensis]|uniref:glycosyltransferase n=1 Tax=Nocardia niigatensis TaxID=209249 RepID=UPI000A056F36|nr:nucleotide disphospho-sugar-binding domain-containing protein [Nocardia niigatensis]
MQVLAAGLGRRGHEVRLLTGAIFLEKAVAQGIPCATLEADTAVTSSEVPDGRVSGLPRRWRNGRADLRASFLEPIESQFRALTAQLARTEFDAVFVDVMFTGAIPLLLGTQPRPPVLVCGVVPLMLSSTDVPPFGMGWQPRPGRDYTAMNRFVRQVLFRADRRRLDSMLSTLGLGPLPVYLLDWPLLADRLLQFTVPSFEYPRGDLPRTVVFTGPLPVPVPGEAVLPTWWSELSTGKTVIHVTQGTWNNTDLGQLIRPTLSALRGRADVVVVACTGGSSSSIGPVPGNAHVTDSVPYGHLLPRVDVMITNGGYGGVQQALCHGVPVIVAGETADKPEVAARVAYAGAGIDLGTARPGSGAIAAAIDRVLSVGEFRSAAARLGREMTRMSPFEVISGVLIDIGAASSRPAVPSRNCLSR